MRNLSLGGALIELPIERKPRVDQQLTITIPFRLKRGTAKVKGRIDRVQEGFMGVEFLRPVY